jgi:hypothetical protein
VTGDDEKIVGYIQQYTAHFQIQIAKGWPVSFVFPTPPDDDARAALRLFVTEIEKGIGKPIIFTTEPGRTPTFKR